MNERKVPFLCGGVFFFLLTQATLPNESAREHRDGNKDEHSEPVLMTDLIYTFTGCQDYGSKKDTSKYKDCLTAMAWAEFLPTPCFSPRLEWDPLHQQKYPPKGG